jgi:hypothetical protein
MDSKSKEFQARVNFAGQEFVPPKVTPLVLEALTLPTKRTDCGSTVEMFSRTYSLFIGYNIVDYITQVRLYFAFASWFPEPLPVAPCLILTGTESEARVVLRLLMRLVRHALPLAEINVEIFDFLPMHLQFTLLIRCVHPSMWRVLSASNHPHAYLPNKKGLTDLFCAKAAYVRSTFGEFGNDAILSIHCTPNGGRLPATNGVTLEKIASDFQPRFLDYRFKNIAQVQRADLDAPTLPTPLRMIARALGACIVDKPELQVEIACLLESQGELLRASRALDPNCVAIEALLARCHGENGPIRVGVSEISEAANTILSDRGETAAFESKRMGMRLAYQKSLSKTLPQATESAYPRIMFHGFQESPVY